MKKLIIFFLLLLIFGGFIAYRYFILSKQTEFGELKILSSPAANVFLDNIAVGKTPYKDKIKVGEYILKLIPEGIAAEAVSWQSKIKVYKKAMTFVERELGSSDLTSAGVVSNLVKITQGSRNSDTGEIEIETEPAGAIVYLDNDEKGVASLILKNVSTGEHELSVYAPGFFRRTLKINVENGYRTTGAFKLAIDPSQQKIEEIRELAEKKSATQEASIFKGKTVVVINRTPTGWLRVRAEPSISASESAKVKPGDEFELLEEKNNWYKISYEKGKTGWISVQYASKKENQTEEDEEE